LVVIVAPLAALSAAVVVVVAGADGSSTSCPDPNGRSAGRNRGHFSHRCLVGLD
jgi:hypothetical protein